MRNVPSVAAGSATPGIALILLSAVIAQTGAGLSALAFVAIGPIGVAAVRQFVAASVLCPIARPPLHRLSRKQWFTVIALAAVYATMNLMLYFAIERIGLGLAVTLEFLGPLSVALLASRRIIDLGCALGAGVGVYVLILPDAETDLLGVACALVAATAWGLYILINKSAGAHLPGLQAPAAASLVSALLFSPVLVWMAFHDGYSDPRWLWAIVAGVCVSAIGFGLDLLALRRVTGRVFGIVASSHPVAATLAGLVILSEQPSAHQVFGVVLIVLANVVAVGTLPRNRTIPDATSGHSAAPTPEGLPS